MKMTKKLLSLLLCLVLFMEFCPLEALAAGSLATEKQIKDAWELSGQGTDAAHWHRGMEPEATWNAEQMDEWLEYVLGEPLYSVENAHTDLKMNLVRMQENATADYNRLTDSANQAYMEYMRRTSYSVEDLREELSTYREQFIMNADIVASLINSLRDETVSGRDKLRYSRQLEKAVGILRKNRAAVVKNYKGWLKQIDAWHADFTGEPNANGASLFAANNGKVNGGAGLDGWVREIMSWHEAPINTTVSVNLHPNGRNNSLLAKLSTARSALGEQQTDTQTIHVIPDTQFVVNLNTPVKVTDPSTSPAPTPMPVLGGTVTVWDAKDIKNPDTVNPYTTAVVTEQGGDATFNVADFTVDDAGIMRLGIIADVDGYQPVKQYVAEVVKGGVYSLSLVPDGSAPQASNAVNAGATPAPNPTPAASKPVAYYAGYNNNDMLRHRYTIYFSPRNDVISDIVLGVYYPVAYTGSRDVTIKYYDVSKVATSEAWKAEEKTKTVKGSEATVDPDYAEKPDGKNYLLYKFSDQWNQILGPGKGITFSIGEEEDKWVDGKSIPLTVERGYVDIPISDTGTGALSGVTRAISKTNACTLLHVTLPSDWKYPAGGSTIGLDVPFAQYIPSLSWDVDGSATFAYGIDVGSLIPSKPDGSGEGGGTEGGEGGGEGGGGTEGGEGGGGTEGGEGGGGTGPTPAPKNWNDDHSWKSARQKEITDNAKLHEKKSAFAKTRAMCGAMWDGVNTQKFNFLGNYSVSMGAFLVVTGQFSGKNEYIDDSGAESYYCNSRSLTAMLGAICTLSVELTAQISFVCFISVGFNVSAAFGLTFECIWDKFDPVHGEFGEAKMIQCGLTILIKLSITVTAGLGLKGVLNVAAVGTGYISFLIQWIFKSGKRPSLLVRGGLSLSIVATVFWLKYSMVIVETKEKVLYDSKEDYHYNTAYTMMDAFMGKALAEGGDDPEGTPEPLTEMTPMEPEYYPALVPQATLVMDDTSMQNASVKYADLDGVTYAFYIAPAANGKGRLTWRNLKTGQTGNTQGTLDKIRGSYRMDDHATWDKIDYAFDVMAEISRDDDVDVAPSLLVSVLCTSALVDETVTVEGETITTKEPKDSYLYVMLLASDGEGGLITIWRKQDERTGSPAGYAFGSREIKRSKEINLWSCELSSDNNGASLKNKLRVFVDFSFSVKEYVSQSEDKGEDRGDCICYSGEAQLPPDLTCGSGIANNLRLKLNTDDVPLLEGNTVRYQCKGGMPVGEYKQGVIYYALERAGDDDPSTLVLMHMDPGQYGKYISTAIRTNDENDDIVFLTPVTHGAGGSNSAGSVFLLTHTTDEDGDHHWLKRADVTMNVGPSGNTQIRQYTVTDYDVEVKTSSFYVKNVFGSVYIYWLSTATKEKETDPDIYRIKAVVYDPATDSVSNELVLAEFSMPEADMVPTDLYIKEDGTGYCSVVVGEGDSVRADVYSFPMNWITSMELNAMTLSDYYVNPASWLDAVVSVMNSGNCGISMYDLELYVQEDDGTETVVETLHCDCLNSTKSAVYLGAGTGGRKVSDGAHTIVRMGDPVEPMQQPDHNVKRIGWDYKKGYTDAQTQYIDSPMLLPGAVKTYKLPLYILDNWQGYKTLFLRVSKNATRANWVAANAAAGSAASNAAMSNAMNAALDVNMNPEIVYTRAEDGTMVRTDNANAILAANGIAANGDVANALSFLPLYPDRVNGTEPLALEQEVHDLNVSHRVYQDANGEALIDITFLNYADTDKALELNAYIYMDDEEEPEEIALPYYPDKTTNAYTHTITLRLDALLGGYRPRNAQVVIKPKDLEETALRNNQFTLHFDDDEVDDPLRFVIQPSPVSAVAGETVKFRAKADGGVKPYTYQWQVWMDEKTGWKDIPDNNKPTLTVENVTPKMNGRKARCIVTDHYYDRIVSEEAMLTVVGGKLPETGDSSNLPLYIAVAALSLLLLWWVRRRGREI